MCEHGDTVPVRVLVPAELAHEGVDTWKTKPVDRCLAELIAALQHGGVRTLACCCGHGERLGEVVLEDGRSLVVAPTAAVAEVGRLLSLGTGRPPP